MLSDRFLNAFLNTQPQLENVYSIDPVKPVSCPLTMRRAWKLHHEWNIPAEALIAPPRTRERKSAA
jgi:hypothetical protein